MGEHLTNSGTRSALTSGQLAELTKATCTWRSRLFGTELCRVFILPRGLHVVRWMPR